MEYVKLQLSVTRSVFWREADAVARGGAISVLCYCADQENHGRIEGGAGWTDQRWQLAGASLEMVDAACAAGLLERRDGDVICHLYDHRGHERLIVQRQQGAHGSKGGKPTHRATPRVPVTGVDSQDALPLGVPPSTHPSTHPSSEGEAAPAPLTMEQETLKALVLDYRPEAAEQWTDLSLLARAKTPAEACAFIRWAVAGARRDGIPCPYPRQVVDRAPAWRESAARAKFLQAQPPKEDHGPQ